MADKALQSLPGFRDFFPELCEVRNYLFEQWKDVARRYHFKEYETPLLEETALYLKKSGGELTTQLFRFEDQGERDVTLRPEVTASLARMVMGSHQQYPKPLRWFEIGQCFRYEKPQKGRGREFFQFNVDVFGEESVAADAELIAIAIDTMRNFGFTQDDFVVRVSDRKAWIQYANDQGIEEAKHADFLQIIDKFERDSVEQTNEKLKPFGLNRDQVQAFIQSPGDYVEDFTAIKENLTARGLQDFLCLDLTIVRGLAYYTGTVFELFDTAKDLRSIAGGGRYDSLISDLSNGKVELPATGFAMGDYVIKNLIESTPHALEKMNAWIAKNQASDVFIIAADKEKGAEVLQITQQLRDLGLAVESAYKPINVGKQFKKAAASGAKYALVIGGEYPELSIKNMETREETTLHCSELTLEHFSS